MGRFTEDGVEYESAPCVRCRAPMIVASSALLVADRKCWPICGECWTEIDAEDDREAGEPRD